MRINLADILFLIFMTMRLTGHIDWSWWWITAPLWGSAILRVVINAMSKDEANGCSRSVAASIPCAMRDRTSAVMLGVVSKGESRRTVCAASGLLREPISRLFLNSMPNPTHMVFDANVTLSAELPNKCGPGVGRRVFKSAAPCHPQC